MRFGYNPAWLEMAHAFPLDPELDLTAGEFFPGNANFGVFMDSCPDRWVQVLMKRREAVEAREQKRHPKNLGPETAELPFPRPVSCRSVADITHSW